jgi:hypothetical protein
MHDQEIHSHYAKELENKLNSMLSDNNRFKTENEEIKKLLLKQHDEEMNIIHKKFEVEKIEMMDKIQKLTMKCNEINTKMTEEEKLNKSKMLTRPVDPMTL